MIYRYLSNGRPAAKTLDKAAMLLYDYERGKIKFREQIKSFIGEHRMVYLFNA